MEYNKLTVDKVDITAECSDFCGCDESNNRSKLICCQCCKKAKQLNKESWFCSGDGCGISGDEGAKKDFT